MIVENNGTAGGNLATQQAASADKDGYTVLMANQGPMVVNPHLFKSVKVDTLKAFDPVSMIADAPLVVVVPKDSRFGSLQELVTFSQKNSDKLTYGSAGNGSASHLAVLLLATAANAAASGLPPTIGTAGHVTPSVGVRSPTSSVCPPSLLKTPVRRMGLR
jgi:tripartite-type tricarboxylate transporter receptor subunit TctC